MSMSYIPVFDERYAGFDVLLHVGGERGGFGGGEGFVNLEEEEGAVDAFFYFDAAGLEVEG